MIRKRKQKKTPKMRQHRVKPTPQIVVSALLNSVYNAEDEHQMSAAVDAMVKALKALSDYEVHAAEVFVNQLYVAMMQHEYTRFGIERTGEEFVKLGLETPTE